jgi:hypothetical protein
MISDAYLKYVQQSIFLLINMFFLSHHEFLNVKEGMLIL